MAVGRAHVHLDRARALDQPEVYPRVGIAHLQLDFPRRATCRWLGCRPGPSPGGKVRGSGRRIAARNRALWRRRACAWVGWDRSGHGKIVGNRPDLRRGAGPAGLDRAGGAESASPADREPGRSPEAPPAASTAWPAGCGSEAGAGTNHAWKARAPCFARPSPDEPAPTARLAPLESFAASSGSPVWPALSAASRANKLAAASASPVATVDAACVARF